ncbi:MAG: hypothetical protein JWR20_1737, partial [Marmoricola sp.]|nr:hypothetical protein [Marmoricola sp.]
MSRLLDTTVCPDCRARLDPGATCTGCGLRLTGPLAVELQGVLRQADGLVERLRSVVSTAPAGLPTLPLAHPPHRAPLATVPSGAPVR